jgi:hypothetical protein
MNDEASFTYRPIPPSVRAGCDAEAKKRQKEGQDRGRDSEHGRMVETLPPTSKAKARDQAGKAVGVSGRIIDKVCRRMESLRTVEGDEARRCGGL